VYFDEFVHCAHPHVIESTQNYSLEKDDPDNDMANLFPVISFVDYSLPRPWPMALPAVPLSDITCHFGVLFGHGTTDSWLNPSPTPIPLNGDCNAKFKKMYKKKNLKEDETIFESRYLICPDTDKLPLMGNGTDCQGGGPCSYYMFTIYKHFGSTAHCNPINLDHTIVSITYINPKLTVDDFDNPWSYGLDTEWSFLSQTQTQIMEIHHFYTTLETDARSFGLRSPSKIEKKLTRNSVLRVDKSH
jgi:hypothetical protein